MQQIPPAPRELRWDTALWHDWPLAFLGSILLLYGGLLTLLLYFASGGKPRDDARLDREAVTAVGRIETVLRSRTSFRGEIQDYVSFSFVDSQGHRELGSSFAPTSEFPVGHVVDVEFLERDSYINRVRGGRIGLLPDYVGPAVWSTVLPGCMLLLLWYASVWRLRRILRCGDVAVAEILNQRRLRLVIPNMLSVHYSFRDRHAELCTGWHWVRERSLLGERLSAGGERLAVIHDRHRPSHSRLVFPAHFLDQMRRALHAQPADEFDE